MHTMLERIARHVAAFKMRSIGHRDGADLDAMVEKHWRDFLPYANCAVAAMREPVSAVEAAGTSAAEQGANAAAVWTAMIDAILNDRPPEA